MMLGLLLDRVESIDMMIDKVERLIEGSSILDAELAAGLATTEPMPSVQRKVDQCAAVIEALERHLKALKAAQ